MRQHVSFITLPARDLDADRTFYIDGLGWTPTLDVPGEIIFFQIGWGTIFGLFEATKFKEDLGDDPVGRRRLAGSRFHKTCTVGRGRWVIADAVLAGATVVKPPQYASFGGYHGHFADPNGAIWEIAHNPGWSVENDGTVQLA